MVTAYGTSRVAPQTVVQKNFNQRPAIPMRPMGPNSRYTNFPPSRVVDLESSRGSVILPHSNHGSITPSSSLYANLKNSHNHTPLYN